MSKIARWIPFFLALAFLALLIQATLMPKRDLPDSQLIGNPAPVLPLSFSESFQQSANQTSFEAFLQDNKFLVINFWASWCTVCAEEAGELEMFWRKNEDRAVLVGIAVQDRKEDAEAFAKKYQMTYPLAYDSGAEAGIEFGIMGLPETFILDRDGVVRQRFVGAVTAKQLEAVIETL